jgi:thiol:disulfide interchange protein DsbD
MEENVWTIPEVSELIRKNFVLVSLYVDDKAKLPADKRFNYKTKAGREKYIKTIGGKWASFQAENFGSASQPQYVILSPNEELLNHPVGYTPANTYIEWLECGLKAGKARIAGLSQK